MFNKTFFAAALALTLVTCVAQPALADGNPPYAYGSTPGALCKVAGVNGGNAANQLSAKAIGARNESTTSNVFVICPFVLTPTPIEGGVVTQLNLQMYSIDGNTRDTTCTAVIGSLDRYVAATYSPKTASVGPDGFTFQWNPDDFNGASASGGILGSAWATVTCLLPPQTAIGQGYAKLNNTIK